VVVAERVVSLVSAAPFLHREGLGLTALGSVLGVLAQWTRNFPVLQRLADAFATGLDPDLERVAMPLATVHLHPPVDLPRQVFCSGANYKKHVIELHVAQTFHKNEGLSREERLAAGAKMMDERAASGTPFFFCKAQSTVTGPHDPIVLPGDDLICTGSPAGNGMHYGRFLRPGDVVEGSITGIGSIRNVCVAEGR
jgi:2,4-didehydro-3-deoxy-L-rhamnonate hydrolase